MEKIIFRVLVLTGACCLSAKHVFVKTGASWGDARSTCMGRFTDVSPLTNQLEELVFGLSAGADEGWIGVYWNKTLKRWVWSGGDLVTYHNQLNLLNDGLDLLSSSNTGNNVYWTKSGWQWKDGAETHGFFCLSLKVVQEEKTWEGALQHCTNSYGSLDSVLSETENLLATNQIQAPGVTERVWIGLRFLKDEWLWVDGLPLLYTKWNPDQDQQCSVNKRCGALTKEGLWESWDCREKFSFICY